MSFLTFYLAILNAPT